MQTQQTFKIGDIVDIVFLGVIIRKCIITNYVLGGGYKGGDILKVTTPKGLNIPYVGLSENQERFANLLINNDKNEKTYTNNE